MSDLGDQLRRWADRAEPVTADEARRRAAGDDGRGSGPRRRAWLAVAAAALLLVGIGAFAAVRADDDGRDDVRSGPSPTTTTATDPTPSTATSPTTTATEPVVPIPPGSFVAHDAQHRLVVVDAATGETTRVLDTFDDPEAPAPEGEPAGMGRYLGRFAVSPDGFVYFETCCEPAVGEIFRVPIEGGEPERVGYGTDPAISPDGTRLALVTLQSLTVVDLRTGEETTYPIADNSQVVALGHPAWSPDGTQLAIERYDESVDAGRVVLVTFDGAEDVLNAASTVAEADDVGTPLFPTFDPDGHLLVVRQRLDADREPEGPAQVELYVVDSYPQFGSVVMRPAGVRAQGSSTGSGHLILLRADGRTEVTRPDGSTELLETDLLDVAW